MKTLNLRDLEEGNLVEIVGLDGFETGAIRMVNKNQFGALFLFHQDGQYPLDQILQEKMNQGFCVISKVPMHHRPSFHQIPI